MLSTYRKRKKKKTKKKKRKPQRQQIWLLGTTQTNKREKEEKPFGTFCYNLKTGSDNRLLTKLVKMLSGITGSIV